METHIFANNRDLHMLLKAADPPDHLFPGIVARHLPVKSQFPADYIVKAVLVQHDRGFIEAVQGFIFNHAVLLDVAEERDLVHDAPLKRPVHARHDDVRVDPERLQLPDGVLGRLGFVLVRAGEVRHQRDMNEETVLMTGFERDLPDCFKERLPLDVADGASDLRDQDVRTGLFRPFENEILDLVRDMRNHLHRLAEIFALALAV